jgi:GTPase
VSGEPTRAGFVALLGAPNAGKSTLLNRLVGTKLAIVTPKAQTTRTRITGIALLGATQIVFTDTPGIFAKPKRPLEKAMVEAAWATVEGADAVALLVDAKEGFTPAVLHIAEGLKARGRGAVLVLNKVDAVAKPALLDLAAKLDATGAFTEIFMVSALTGDGVADVARHFAETLPLSPWLFPKEHLTDAPLRFLAAEVTREKIFLNLFHELPYATAVETAKWEERKDGSVKIDQTIVCERDGQKAILIGKGGAMLKKIGAESRRELTELLQRRVHLFLFVKVDPGWAARPASSRALGHNSAG